MVYYGHTGGVQEGTLDPNYQQEELSRFGNALNGIVGMLQERQARAQKEREDEVQRFLRESIALPELANSSWAEDLVKRYGQTTPEVPAIVNVLKNRSQLADQRTQAGAKLLSAADALQQHRTAMQAQLLGAPDYIPAQDGMGPPAPNTAKQTALSYLQQTDGQPALWGHALDTLSPSEQIHARLWWKDQMHGGGRAGDPGAASELQLPVPLNMKDLPPNVRAAVIMRAGQYPGALSNMVDPGLLSDPGFQATLRQLEKMDPTARDKWLDQNRQDAASLLAQNRSDLASAQNDYHRGWIAQQGRNAASLQKSAQGFQMQLYDMGLKGNLAKAPDPVDAAMIGANQNLQQYRAFAGQKLADLKAQLAANPNKYGAEAKAIQAQIQQLSAAAPMPMDRGVASRLVGGPGGLNYQIATRMIDPSSAWDELGQMVADYQTGGADKSPQGRLNFALAGSHQRRFQANGAADRSANYTKNFNVTHDPNVALAAAFHDTPGVLRPTFPPAQAREMMRREHARMSTPIPTGAPGAPLGAMPSAPEITIPEAATESGSDVGEPPG